MKFTSSSKKLRQSIAALGTVVLTTLSTFGPAKAVDFGQQEVQQNKFVAVAMPYAGNQYNLFIFEQISKTQPCWQLSSSGSAIAVDLLLQKFDFTGICGRNSDTNGYSIRKAGQDLSWRYNLNIVKRDSELVLLGVSSTEPNAPPLEIGRTYGVTNGFTKIVLNPGWRFTKRTYNGKVLGHTYLTSD
jgi:N-acetylmuramoyl-L-alanine amidase